MGELITLSNQKRVEFTQHGLNVFTANKEYHFDRIGPKEKAKIYEWFFSIKPETIEQKHFLDCLEMELKTPYRTEEFYFGICQYDSYALIKDFSDRYYHMGKLDGNFEKDLLPEYRSILSSKRHFYLWLAYQIASGKKTLAEVADKKVSIDESILLHESHSFREDRYVICGHDDSFPEYQMAIYEYCDFPRNETFAQIKYCGVTLHSVPTRTD